MDPGHQLDRHIKLEPESRSSQQIPIEDHNEVKKQPWDSEDEGTFLEDNLKNNNVAGILCKLAREKSAPPVHM